MYEHNENSLSNLSRRGCIKSADIGAGAAAICSLSSSEAKAIAPDQVPEWNFEADVVVLGTGFAGQVSAITAHDDGASVLMIEKAPEKHQGGMLRNIESQVLDVFSEPIPRLYSAGEIGDRVWANLYECAKNVGEGCIAAGRKAGKNAAAEKPWA